VGASGRFRRLWKDGLKDDIQQRRVKKGYSNLCRYSLIKREYGFFLPIKRQMRGLGQASRLRQRALSAASGAGGRFRRLWKGRLRDNMLQRRVKKGYND